MFKTHLREVYIKMILCDTELRTSVLLKKGQTSAAGEKSGIFLWDFQIWGVGSLGLPETGS